MNLRRTLAEFFDSQPFRAKCADILREAHPMAAPCTMIVTAADQEHFDDATLYDVTVVGERGMDSNVRWGYICHAAKARGANTKIICRHRDGTTAGHMTLETN